MHITVALPADFEDYRGKTLDVHGEGQTYYGTKFPWVVHFPGAAIESLDAPPAPNLVPKFKPVRFTINRRYKALYANVSPTKIEYTKEKAPANNEFKIEIQNKLTELEQMIFEIGRL